MAREEIDLGYGDKLSISSPGEGSDDWEIKIIRSGEEYDHFSFLPDFSPSRFYSELMMRLYHTISNSAVDEHTPEIQAALKRLEDGYQPKPGPVHPVLIARILRELSDLADDESVNSKVRRRARGLAFQIDMAKGKAEGKVR